MKTLILTFVTIFCFSIAGAQDINRIGNFVPGANYHNNLVAKQVANTGKVPLGYMRTTAGEFARSKGYQALRVKVTPSSEFNQNGGLGVILNEHELILLKSDAKGGWALWAVEICGNYVTYVEPIGSSLPAQQEGVSLQQNNVVYQQPVAQSNNCGCPQPQVVTERIAPEPQVVYVEQPAQPTQAAAPCGYKKNGKPRPCNQPNALDWVNTGLGVANLIVGIDSNQRIRNIRTTNIFQNPISTPGPGYNPGSTPRLPVQDNTVINPGTSGGYNQGGTGKGASVNDFYSVVRR